MSQLDAIKDGIRIEDDMDGFPCYYPPCHLCGTPVYTWSYLRGTKYTCRDCRKEMVAQIREEKNMVSCDKKQRKLDIAIKRISKVTKTEHYDKAITMVKKYLDKPGWFQSTEEIMVALELIRRGVKAYHQVKVFEYRIDFVLTDFQVALEIDGPIYHGKDQQKQQSIRDEAVVQKLGNGWEVIRNSTDNINMNVTRLIPGIRAILQRRIKSFDVFI